MRQREDAPAAAQVSLALAKEDFKFSAAHFTVFDETTAELLHGHNYQVELVLRGGGLDELGFLVDIGVVKEHIRKLCARLDERVLIPENCRYLELRTEAGETELCYAERRYRFPSEDLLMLPLRNITIEELARYLWSELAPKLPSERIDSLSVYVSETSGQRASWDAPLPLIDTASS